MLSSEGQHIKAALLAARATEPGEPMDVPVEVMRRKWEAEVAQVPLPPRAALSYGPEAAALGPAAGRVLAVLRNAVYLESDDGRIIGIVGEDAPDGPLTLRVRDLPGVVRTLSDQPEAPFRATEDTVDIMGRVRIGWENARRWTPAPPHPTGSRPVRRRAAEALITAISVLGPQEGAGRLAPLLPGLLLGRRESALPGLPALQDGLLHRIAACIINARTAFDAGSEERAARAFTGLLGLGPGLTPSGDDVLMGLIASLVWQGAPEPDAPVAALVTTLRDAAPQRTTRISARLLWHAGAGVLYAPAMALGAALLRGDDAAVPRTARPLFAIGGTSGVDLAVGLLAGMLIGAPNRK
jgi:hypothetical protein